MSTKIVFYFLSSYFLFNIAVLTVFFGGIYPLMSKKELMESVKNQVCFKIEDIK
jgi:hypothetical protein